MISLGNPSSDPGLVVQNWPPRSVKVSSGVRKVVARDVKGTCQGTVRLTDLQEYWDCLWSRVFVGVELQGQAPECLLYILVCRTPIQLHHVHTKFRSVLVQFRTTTVAGKMKPTLSQFQIPAIKFKIVKKFFQICLEIFCIKETSCGVAERGHALRSPWCPFHPEAAFKRIETSKLSGER